MRIQRPEKYIYQININYMSIEMCSQKTKSEIIPL